MDSRTMGACRKKSNEGRKSNRKREKPVTSTVVIWPVSTWNMLSLNFRMKATDKPRAAERRGEEAFELVYWKSNSSTSNVISRYSPVTSTKARE